MAEKNRSWKRVIAGLLALTLVVGNVPANVGVGGLFGSSDIVASAATIGTWTSGNCTVTLDDEGKLTVSKTEGKTTGNMADYSGSSNRPWNNVREQITSVVIENGVTSIGASAFGECSNLASVTIPNSVTNIGKNAFIECSNLASVTIPESVISIGAFAFFGCSDLASVTIPNSVTSIGGAAFASCNGLTSVTIPNSVTSIGNNVFNGCSGLTSVTIPNSVTSIGNNAFSYCSGLTSVTIPDSVTSIGGAAFYECSNLTSIEIPDSVTSIGDYAFSDCSNLASVTFTPGTADATLEIGEDAFVGTKAGTKVAYADGENTNKLFDGTTKITTDTLPTEVLY